MLKVYSIHDHGKEFVAHNIEILWKVYLVLFSYYNAEFAQCGKNLINNIDFNYLHYY